MITGVDSKQLQNSTLITGFRTLGEVGYLAVRHLILSTKPRKIGAIVTKYQTDITFLDEYGLATPFDIFFDEGKKIIYILNHLLPIRREWADFSRTIIKWSLSLNVSNMFLIGGLDRRYKTTQASMAWLKNNYSPIELNMPLLEKQQLIIGPLALLIIYSELYKVPASILLPYADRDRPDPAAAAEAVNVISELMGLKIDVNQLLEDAKRIEEEITKQLKQLQDEMYKSQPNRHYM
ncbi:carboxylate--amine ligase [Sulfolobales archaeon HS-7]|nr:carboxylate--amine ligase [Sulfolobales archaeon HS-7]